MNRRLLAIMLALVMVMSLVIMTGCKKEEEGDGDTVQSEMLKREMQIEDNDFEDPAFVNEDDGAEVTVKAHDEKDFIGIWQAPSSRAQYLYGNINLRINDDGTWKGNITEEDFRGEWTYDGEAINIKDTEGLIDWKLFYADDGTLMVDDNEEPGDPLVLKPGGNFGG